MPRRILSPELTKDSIRELAQTVKDPETLARMIVACAKHAPDDADVIALAEAEINAALRNRGAGITRLHAIMQLHPASKFIAPTATPAEREETAAPDLPPGFWGDGDELRIIKALFPTGCWIVLGTARQLTRSTDGSGKVKRSAINAALFSAGLARNSVYIFQNWIKPGIGKLWNYDKRRKVLYPYAPAHVKTRRGVKGRLNVAQMALDANRAELVTTNPPGQKMVYIPYTSTLKGMCGNLLKAWHSTRRDPGGHISRPVLCTLFGVTTKTLIGWENTAGIEREHVYAQFVEGDEHLNARRAQRAIPIAEMTPLGIRRRWRVQWSNRYHDNELPKRQHTHNPRARQRAALLTLEIATGKDLPNANWREASATGGRVGFKSFYRLNFYDKQTSKKHVSAFDQVRKSIQKHEDYDRPRTAELGHDHRFKCAVVEITTGEKRTDLSAQLSRTAEDAWFAANGGRGAAVRLLRKYAV